MCREWRQFARLLGLGLGPSFPKHWGPRGGRLLCRDTASRLEMAVLLEMWGKALPHTHNIACLLTILARLRIRDMRDWIQLLYSPKLPRIECAKLSVPLYIKLESFDALHQKV